MNVEYLVVHCSATPPSMDIGVDAIRRWHLNRGWSDIGYHFVIPRDGTLEIGRDASIPGAHARGYNRVSLGICLVGGVEEDGQTPEENYTAEQYETLRALLAALKSGHPDAEILGHRDLPHVRKACPCFDVREWLET